MSAFLCFFISLQLTSMLCDVLELTYNFCEFLDSRKVINGINQSLATETVCLFIFVGFWMLEVIAAVAALLVL